MKFLTAVHTDAGFRKDINQDSLLVMQADTEAGRVLLAAVCDGMGGLAKGEVASAAVIQALRLWFSERLPNLLQEGFRQEELWRQWRDLIDKTGKKIADYGRGIHALSGTTCAALFVIGEDYYIMNVGDSRIYWLTDNIYQLTRDQTWVQREFDRGTISLAETFTHPNRSVLLQCVGADVQAEPALQYGRAAPGQVFLICSDGFRHVISPQEFYEKLQPRRLKNPRDMKERLAELTNLNMRRGETDNISAILIKTC